MTTRSWTRVCACFKCSTEIWNTKKVKHKEMNVVAAEAEWALLPFHESHFISYYAVNSAASGHRDKMNGWGRSTSELLPWTQWKLFQTTFSFLSEMILTLGHSLIYIYTCWGDKWKRAGDQGSLQCTRTVRWMVGEFVLGETDAFVPLNYCLCCTSFRRQTGHERETAWRKRNERKITFKWVKMKNRRAEETGKISLLTVNIYSLHRNTLTHLIPATRSTCLPYSKTKQAFENAEDQSRN